MNAFIKRSALLFSAVTLLILVGCDQTGIRGNREITTQQHAVSAFTTISASGAFQIEWKPGPAAASITTDSNLQDHVEVTNRGNELHLTSRGNIRPSHSIKAVISSPALASAQLHGACKFSAHQLTGDAFAIETAGASHVYLDGTVTHLLADMTGASNLQARELQTASAEMSLTGASRADVTVSDSLHVSISGAGKVTYAGEPKTIEKSVSGAGRVSRRE